MVDGFGTMDSSPSALFSFTQPRPAWELASCINKLVITTVTVYKASNQPMIFFRQLMLYH